MPTEQAFILAFIALVAGIGYVVLADGINTHLSGVSSHVKSATINMSSPLGSGRSFGNGSPQSSEQAEVGADANSTGQGQGSGMGIGGANGTGVGAANGNAGLGNNGQGLGQGNSGNSKNNNGKKK